MLTWHEEEDNFHRHRVRVTVTLASEAAPITVFTSDWFTSTTAFCLPSAVDFMREQVLIVADFAGGRIREDTANV